MKMPMKNGIIVVFSMADDVNSDIKGPVYILVKDCPRSDPHVVLGGGTLGRSCVYTYEHYCRVPPPIIWARFPGANPLSSSGVLLRPSRV